VSRRRLAEAVSRRHLAEAVSRMSFKARKISSLKRSEFCTRDSGQPSTQPGPIGAHDTRARGRSGGAAHRGLARLLGRDVEEELPPSPGSERQHNTTHAAPTHPFSRRMAADLIVRRDHVRHAVPVVRHRAEAAARADLVLRDVVQDLRNRRAQETRETSHVVQDLRKRRFTRTPSTHAIHARHHMWSRISYAPPVVMHKTRGAYTKPSLNPNSRKRCRHTHKTRCAAAACRGQRLNTGAGTWTRFKFVAKH
jgi:hypothetical protein